MGGKSLKKIFVCSMGDLFHDDVMKMKDSLYENRDFGMLNDIFNVIRSCTQHTFLILTKRPRNMKSYFSHLEVCSASLQSIDYFKFPIPNVWLGTTCENQRTADERIPTLLEIPAAKHFVSVEPMLESVYLSASYLTGKYTPCWGSKIDQVICGGENSNGARPTKTIWVKNLRDNCVQWNVPFFFKGWGSNSPLKGNLIDGKLWQQFPEKH
jgi:protein gp37